MGDGEGDDEEEGGGSGGGKGGKGGDEDKATLKNNDNEDKQQHYQIPDNQKNTNSKPGKNNYNSEDMPMNDNQNYSKTQQEEPQQIVDRVPATQSNQQQMAKPVEQKPVEIKQEEEEKQFLKNNESLERVSSENDKIDTKKIQMNQSNQQASFNDDNFKLQGKVLFFVHLF